MFKKRLRYAFLLVLVAPLLALFAAPAAASQTYFLFSTCQKLHQHLLRTPDGDYLLYNNGRIISVYCYDMAGNPREYVDLADSGPQANFSQYTAGGAAPGTNVRTTFTKLRINPATLMVDIGDLTFATSTGSLLHGGQPVTSMPYGVAMACTAPGNAAGVGNIDLQGTAFAVNNAFVVGGFEAAGTATPSANNQMIALTGGGFCGWISPAPAMFDPFNPAVGNYHLQLACAPTAVTGPQPSLCVQVS